MSGSAAFRQTRARIRNTPETGNAVAQRAEESECGAAEGIIQELPGGRRGQQLSSGVPGYDRREQLLASCRPRRG